MLRVEENQRLTQVGPGTPMGELMRRYWQPVAATSELIDDPTKAVRILGESLVLYKDRGGRYGLIGESCAHRRVNMLYGIPEEEGLRCPYHGWLYNAEGQCVETPAEPAESTFKDRIQIPAYPVEELGGLIWAYLGPKPAPLLPRWDVYVWDNVYRNISWSLIPCNWLQVTENAVDPVHGEWLHGWYAKYALEQKGMSPEEAYQQVHWLLNHHKKIGFDLFEYGIMKRRLVEGMSEESEHWRVGHPQLFPNVIRNYDNGSLSHGISVPIDDTHTWQLSYRVLAFAPGFEVPKQERIPFYEMPRVDENGRLITDFVAGQDRMAMTAQGEIVDRSLEKLADSDRGVILYRRLLKEQMRIVEDGGDPLNVFRDPAKNVCITLPEESTNYPGGPKQRVGRRNASGAQQHTPAYIIEEMDALFAKAAGASTSPAP